MTVRHQAGLDALQVAAVELEVGSARSGIRELLYDLTKMDVGRVRDEVLHVSG